MESITVVPAQSTEKQERTMTWNIKTLPGQSEIGLRVRVRTPSLCSLLLLLCCDTCVATFASGFVCLSAVLYVRAHLFARGCYVYADLAGIGRHNGRCKEGHWPVPVCPPCHSLPYLLLCSCDAVVTCCLSLISLLPFEVLLSHSNFAVARCSVNFELPMCAVSGLEIHRLLVFDRGQSVNPHRWIRYITSSSSYVVRHEIK